jgi:hypothetical protein
VLGLAWSPDGREVWFTGAKSGASQALYAVNRSGAERLLFRAPATLTLHDVARDGRVLITRDAWGAGVTARTKGASAERDFSWLDGTMAWDLSADGTTAILEESWEGGGAARSVYLRTTDGQPAVRLSEGVPLALSPDKQWVVSTPVAADQLTLLPTGVGQPKVLPCGAVKTYGPTARWLPEGGRILFSGTEAGKSSRIYLQSIESGDPRPITDEGVFGRLAVLPGGETFVTRGLDRRLVTAPVIGGAPRPIAGAEPPDTPVVVSADGTWLYVQADTQVPAPIARINLRDGRRETVRTLRPIDPSGVTSVLRIVMTPDAETYAYAYIRAISELYLVTGIR